MSNDRLMSYGRRMGYDGLSLRRHTVVRSFRRMSWFSEYISVWYISVS
jgi:hypothetical protein